jgi:hypothetical protein
VWNVLSDATLRNEIINGRPVIERWKWIINPPTAIGHFAIIRGKNDQTGRYQLIIPRDYSAGIIAEYTYAELLNGYDPTYNRNFSWEGYIADIHR